jgi:hypothetical protein
MQQEYAWVRPFQPEENKNIQSQWRKNIYGQGEFKAIFIITGQF